MIRLHCDYDCGCYYVASILLCILQAPCIAVLICDVMILLYIRDIEGITGGHEAYKNSDLYKMAAWLLVVVSIAGLTFLYVLEKVHDHYFDSPVHNDVSFYFGYMVGT